MVYLHRPTTVLLAQIKARGRSYEQGISAEYLDQIARVRGVFSGAVLSRSTDV